MSDNFTIDDAIGVIIDQLRRRLPELQSYGYDVWLPEIWSCYIRDNRKYSPNQDYLEEERQGQKLSSVFYAAGWELCRRGILRPGVSTVRAQATSEGSAGSGYCLTPMGREWLTASDPLFFIPIESARLGQMLGRFQGRFGSGFQQRAQEAVKCYFATAYLACCAMCGAAAEGILLSAAIEARGGNEAAVLKEYYTGGGRSRVETRLLGQAKPEIANSFRTFTDLLKYWRDDSAHGTASMISDIEAYDALSRLLRFAHFTNDRWEELTSRPTK